MRIFLILIFLIIAISSCSKKEKTIKLPPSTEKEIVKVYQDGLEALKDLIAPGNAPVVDNLEKDGAIVIGRTNTPEFSPLM